MRLFMAPGNLVCHQLKMSPASDDCQVLRSFINVMIWGAVAATMALTLAL